MPLLVQDFGIAEYFEKFGSFQITEDQPLVSIITTAYNNTRFSAKYFETINKQTYKNIEVIYSDQHSTDDTYENAKPLLKHGKILKVIVDVGCAEGNNRCVRQAKGKFVFLLGPDTWVDEKCVENLVKTALENENTIYAPKQMSYDGTVI